MITCSEAARQLWAYLEHEASAADAAHIEEHLSVCRSCCGELEFAQEMRAFLADHAHPALPHDVQQRLEGFIDALEEVGDE